MTAEEADDVISELGTREVSRRFYGILRDERGAPIKPAPSPEAPAHD